MKKGIYGNVKNQLKNQNNVSFVIQNLQSLTNIDSKEKFLIKQGQTLLENKHRYLLKFTYEIFCF